MKQAERRHYNVGEITNCKQQQKRIKYVSVWQQTLFCLCTTAKNQTVTTTVVGGCGNLDISQDTKVKAKCFQQLQDCTCFCTEALFRKKVISAQLQRSSRKTKCISYSMKYFSILRHQELMSLYKQHSCSTSGGYKAYSEIVRKWQFDITESHTQPFSTT